jgi:hypothetical protein
MVIGHRIEIIRLGFKSFRLLQYRMSGLKTDCVGHTMEDVDDTIRLAKETGNKERLELAKGYKRRGKSTIHYCVGTEPTEAPPVTITTCRGCKVYKPME